MDAEATAYRIIIINGIRLQYTVFKLNNGTLNVGRIHEIK